MAVAVALLVLLTHSVLPFAWAVMMADDPKAFEGVPWGAALTESPTFELIKKHDRTNEYLLKQQPLTLASIPVESMKFTTIDGQFARVTVRYKGEQNHEAMLGYLQSRYGPLDRTPGQTMTGANQQYSWHGPYTEINLTYTGKTETGVIFFESSALAFKFNERFDIPDGLRTVPLPSRT